MASTTAWTSSHAANRPNRPGRPNRTGGPRLRVAAVVAVTFAFVIAGAAILAVVGTLAWDASLAAASTSNPPPTTVAVSVSDDEGDRDPAEADTDADAPVEAVDGAVGDEVEVAGPAEQMTGDDGTDTDTTGPGDDDDDGSDASADADDAAAGDETTGSTDTGSQDAGSDAAADGGTGDGGTDAEPALSAEQVQEKLREHRFLIGPADGKAGQQTTAAVMAYQRVNGLSVDGVVGPATTAALLAGSAEPTLAGGPADRIEVDLDAQLLHLVEGGERVVTLQVSSGSGGTYETASGGSARAVTPVGDFTVERRIHGVRNAPLGTLYDPLYFHRGFAIHGSGSVPAYPASHGCIRVSMADAAWLIQRIPDGMPVQLRGGTHVFTP